LRFIGVETHQPGSADLLAIAVRQVRFVKRRQHPRTRIVADLAARFGGGNLDGRYIRIKIGCCIQAAYKKYAQQQKEFPAWVTRHGSPRIPQREFLIVTAWCAWRAIRHISNTRRVLSE